MPKIMICRGCSDISGVINYYKGQNTADFKSKYSNKDVYRFETYSINEYEKLSVVKTNLVSSNKILKDYSKTPEISSEVISNDGVFSFKDPKLNEVLNSRFNYLMIVGASSKDCIKVGENIILIGSINEEKFMA